MSPIVGEFRNPHTTNGVVLLLGLSNNLFTNQVYPSLKVSRGSYHNLYQVIFG